MMQYKMNVSNNFKPVLFLFVIAFITGLLDADQKPAGILTGAADPTIIAAPPGAAGYYVYATGRGLPFYYSKDLVHWSRLGRVFKKAAPSWALAKVPGTRGIWAPHIEKFNGLYHLYYSCSTFGKQRSVIGLAVNRTIDPNDKNYQWKDLGKVIESEPGDSFNAIDPAVFVDHDGKVYLFWGSYWSGIKAVELDSRTGKPKQNALITSIADRCEPPDAVEASYVIRRKNSYFLFVSFGSCCNGAESTYRIMIGRSEKVLGGYVDASGRPLLKGGGTLLLASDERWRGPGHNSILNTKGKDWLVHHTYDMKHLNRHRILQVRPLYWQEDDWPVAGDPLILTYGRPEKKITPRLIPGTWAYTINYKKESTRRIELLENGKIRNSAPGSGWSLKGNHLVLRWKNRDAPGGESVDDLILESSGTSCIGRNQNFDVVRAQRSEEDP